MRIDAGVATDVGRVREGNEDAFAIEPPLYAVADGMGGARGGEVASQLALQTVVERFRAGDGSPADLVREANRAVFERAAADRKLSGMGTTLTAAMQVDEAVHLVHVGDSRAYLLRAGALRQLTDDHTLVNRMIEAGEITSREAETHPHRNVLLRVLGTEPDVSVDEQDVGLLEGDRLLLCSDGLTGMVGEEQLRSILEATQGMPQEAAERLVRAANNAGGIDNITAVVLDVLPGEPEATGATTAAPGREDPVVAPPAGVDPGTTEEPGRSRTWIRAALIAALAVVVLLAAFAGFRRWLDTRWFLGVANGHVAIYQGIPADVFGFELSHVAEETDVSASDVMALPLYADLGDGINVDSREEAEARVDQMRKDLRKAQRGGGGP